MKLSAQIGRILLKYGGAISLLLLCMPITSALASNTFCDSKLGKNYDEQTVEVKMARLNLYLDCRQLQDLRFLQMLRNDISNNTQKWQNRAKRVVRSSISTKQKVVDAELKVVQMAEREVLKTQYLTQYAEIEASRNPENAAEVAIRMREATTAHRGERAVMTTSQNQKTRSIRRTFTQCKGVAANYIDQMMGVETFSISEQFLDKTAWLKSEYGELKQTPASMSVNGYTGNLALAAKLETDTGDREPVGEIEGAGSGTITGPKGGTRPIAEGSPIHMGDVVNMDEGSSCTIVFADESSFELPDGSRVEVDEYLYEPNPKEANRFFQVLRGVFVFISGVIGNNEPIDVDIDSQAIGDLSCCRG
jgi:hypothetical protein